MEDVEKFRKEAKAWIEKNGIVFRSCWNCNPAHEYLKKADYPFLCLWCGHWYYKGVDITQDRGDEECGRN